MQDYLMIGTVLKPQGVRGECKIRPYAADLDLFPSWTTLYVPEHGTYRPLSCRVTRVHEGYVYACLDGSSTADEAERYRGQELYIDRAHAAPPEENGHLIADLLGCHAVTPAGEDLGELTDVLQHGSVDTWVFRGSEKGWMAPALLEVFPRVDVENQRILVNPDRLQEVALFED